MNQKYYLSFDDFIADMNLLFSNFLKFRGESNIDLELTSIDHKMYKYCDAVQKRFEKFIEKAKQKTNLD